MISSAGEGTSVRMALPAVAVAETVVVEEREPVRVPEKLTRRVLVLEDEPLIRHLISQHLGLLGCETVETADGNETVARYREAMESGRRFDLVIFDLSIPGGMGGAAAMELIRKMDPGVCAIVSSGYSDDPVMSRHQDFGFRAVLPKPYEPSALREMAVRLLAREA
jgi:CheY-like chemotaxis protein